MTVGTESLQRRAGAARLSIQRLREYISKIGAMLDVSMLAHINERAVFTLSGPRTLFPTVRDTIGHLARLCIADDPAHPFPLAISNTLSTTATSSARERLACMEEADRALRELLEHDGFDVNDIIHRLRATSAV